MDSQIQTALENDQVIDITTIGRKTGKPRRIEIWFHRWNGRLFITGLPGTRDWYANLLANPDFTFHLKHTAQADIPATARPITEEGERCTVLTGLLAQMDRSQDLEDWVARSPLVEVTLHR